MEYVSAFPDHSEFRIHTVNTFYGLPANLNRLRFRVVVLHYSLFGAWPFALDDFYTYLEACESSYKVAIFQDEYRFCTQRFAFINHFKIDCIFTRVRPGNFDDTYGKCAGVSNLVHVQAGYVNNSLMRSAAVQSKPDSERSIDIGYRSRHLPYYTGRGAQEKHEIAGAFLAHAEGSDLVFDISSSEADRILGRAWYPWLANCRGVLGVEGGVSVFDLEGVVYAAYDRIMAEHAPKSFAEFAKLAGDTLEDWEDRIPVRTLTPRHFEAAAFRVCQILFEGEYSGILKPMVHYIPLKKDFSNYSEVIDRFRNADLRQELTENAYDDLIESGKYSYQGFVKQFDQVLVAAGIKPGPADPEVDRMAAGLNSLGFAQRARAVLVAMRHRSFPGRNALVSLYRKMRPRPVVVRNMQRLPWQSESDT